MQDAIRALLEEIEELTEENQFEEALIKVAELQALIEQAQEKGTS